MFTGTVKHLTPTDLATVEAGIVGDYLVVVVTVGGYVIVRFPMPPTSDVNAVENATVNILNQTGLVNERAIVELTETP